MAWEWRKTIRYDFEMVTATYMWKIASAPYAQSFQDACSRQYEIPTLLELVRGFRAPLGFNGNQKPSHSNINWKNETRTIFWRAREKYLNPR